MYIYAYMWIVEREKLILNERHYFKWQTNMKLIRPYIKQQFNLYMNHKHKFMQIKTAENQPVCLNLVHFAFYLFIYLVNYLFRRTWSIFLAFDVFKCLNFLRSLMKYGSRGLSRGISVLFSRPVCRQAITGSVQHVKQDLTCDPYVKCDA